MHTESDCKTLVIVDDHPLVREGLKAVLAREQGLIVVGEAGNVGEAMALIQALAPDMAIIDLALADGDGLDLIKRLKAHCPNLKMLVCSMRDEALFAERALHAGAIGYVHKSEVALHIIDAIRATLMGRMFLSPAMVERLLKRNGPGQQPAGLSVDNLSDRELQVFGLIGDGQSTAEIAQVLHLSVKTIETHRENIKRKLQLGNAAELTRSAIIWSQTQY
ncbi:response regulator [Thiorhodovibrio frisius]|uniref:Response regulator containing a CheY-like receiver domain and an HTH DNA-binding domain n=1 Tax=Thiorhodovibrio frisius TaxID=631362 RepID=H8Z725_9GAMM|nr:response regulator transcription factor [Thiorhodovibrio frisius]EIC20824.1 response regulator containing a CheY-like receiver domain and an HTH DNA-binding domain [Thiorhodovibrio frisius]WPL21876.1 Response regulator protein VraR [Thiorhodovibrio frisius]